MPIEYAILGLLSNQPMSGYDLKKIISRSSTFYWTGNSNQVYHQLLTLHRDGSLSLEVIYQENKPPRKIYAITQQGMDRLVNWLHSSPQLPERKHTFLIQLSWAHLLPDAKIEGLLKGYEDEIEIQLILHKNQRRSNEPVVPVSPRQALIWEYINQNWTGFYQTELEWVKSLRKAIFN